MRHKKRKKPFNTNYVYVLCIEKNFFFPFFASTFFLFLSSTHLRGNLTTRSTRYLTQTVSQSFPTRPLAQLRQSWMWFIHLQQTHIAHKSSQSQLLRNQSQVCSSRSSSYQKKNFQSESKFLLHFLSEKLFSTQLTEWFPNLSFFLFHRIDRFASEAISRPSYFLWHSFFMQMVTLTRH